MKITVIYSKDSGVDYHRLLQPTKYLAQEYKDVEVTLLETKEVLQSEHLFNCDIVLFNMIFFYDFKWLLRLKSKYGFKLVMDCDDYPVLEPYQTHYWAWSKYNFKQVLYDGLKLADLVFVTNEQLAQVYGLHTKKIVIVPNALSFDEENVVHKVSSKDTRFIYVAGNNHEFDFYTIKPVIENLAKNKLFQEKGSLTLCGYNKPFDEENLYDRMETVAKTCGKYVRRELLSVQQYLEHYSHGDIAIAPLINNMYNACKSNLKFIEAAYAKLPLICNSGFPYSVDKLAPGIVFCNDLEGWRKAIEFFLKNPNQIAKYGEANYIYAKQNYNLRTVNILRYKAMRDLVTLDINKYIPIIKSYTSVVHGQVQRSPKP